MPERPSWQVAKPDLIQASLTLMSLLSAMRLGGLNATVVARDHLLVSPPCNCRGWGGVLQKGSPFLLAAGLFCSGGLSLRHEG